ncbi:hypothetical protein TorRG33x02_251320, partial [Trema orientale]
MQFRCGKVPLRSACSAAVLSVLGIFSSGASIVVLYLERCGAALASCQKLALCLERCSTPEQCLSTLFVVQTL